MKKVLLIVGVIVAALMVWRLGYLGTPVYGDWQSLELTEGRSFWPYVTQVDIGFNGSQVYADDKLIGESRWLDISLWNGNRVDDVTIYAVTVSGEYTMYPGPEHPRQMTFDGTSAGTVSGVLWMEEDDRFKPPAREVRLSFDAPPDSVIAYRIVAIDGQGNTCEKTILVSSIL